MPNVQQEQFIQQYAALIRSENTRKGTLINVYNCNECSKEIECDRSTITNLKRHLEVSNIWQYKVNKNGLRL